MHVAMRLQIFPQNIPLLWQLINHKHFVSILALLRCHTRKWMQNIGRAQGENDANTTPFERINIASPNLFCTHIFKQSSNLRESQTYHIFWFKCVCLWILHIHVNFNQLIV